MHEGLLAGLAALRRGAAEGLTWPDASGDEARATQMEEYLSELLRWNKAFNLTAITEPGEMVVRHLLDSLSIAPWVHGRILDVGTGAGLPAIPLAIMDPELDVIALDSTAKKVRFMLHIVRHLNLQNVEPMHARIEEYTALAPFDTVVSRAFASISDFANATRHLLGPHTRLLAMKGQRPDDELEALPGWIEVEAVEKLAVPGLHAERHLVIMSLT